MASSSVSTRMWRARTSSSSDIGLHGFVVDLAHLLVGRGRLDVVLQHQAHQQLVVHEGFALLEAGVVLQVALLGFLRDQDDVGDVGDQLLALGRRVHLMDVFAEIVLRHRKIALADLGCRSRWRSRGRRWSRPGFRRRPSRRTMNSSNRRRPAGPAAPARRAAANFSPCERSAEEFGLLGEAYSSVVMARSLIDAGHSRRRRPDSRAIAPPLQWWNIGPILSRT